MLFALNFIATHHEPIYIIADIQNIFKFSGFTGTPSHFFQQLSFRKYGILPDYPIRQKPRFLPLEYSDDYYFNKITRNWMPRPKLTLKELTVDDPILYFYTYFLYKRGFLKPFNYTSYDFQGEALRSHLEIKRLLGENHFSHEFYSLALYERSLPQHIIIWMFRNNSLAANISVEDIMVIEGWEYASTLGLLI